MSAQVVAGRSGYRVLLLEAILPLAHHRTLLEQVGIDVVVTSADEILSALDDNWSLKLVVADVASLSPPALDRLSRANGPQLLAIVGDDGAELGGMALGANLAGFLPRDASTQEYVAAVEAALATGHGPNAVAELSDTGIARIGALGAEVERIVAALATLAAGERRIASGGPLPVTAVQVRAIIKARRLRERFFPAVLFGDPVWDMLLDLTAARLEAKPVAVSSLCLAAAVPTTTALRQIKALCDAGMFVRRVDEQDARRTFIALSEPSAQSMLDYLGSLRGEGPVI